MEQHPPENHEEEMSVTLHDRQWEVYRCKSRFRVLVAGRRFGKTHLALLEMLNAAQDPNKTIWYVGPTKEQAEFIAWDQIKTLTKGFWSRKPIETPPRIHLESGFSIFLKSGFNPDTLRDLAEAGLESEPVAI